MKFMENIGVFCASSDRMENIYYERAEELGKWIGESGRKLIYGGANCGLMEALAKSVKENGGNVIGIVPKKLIENNRVSDHIDVSIYCNDLSDRKELLIDKSDILIVLPGSVGTLDEAFCTISSNTFGMNSKKVVFWNINGFYDLLFKFLESLEKQGVLNKPLEKIMYVVNDLNEIKDICER